MKEISAPPDGRCEGGGSAPAAAGGAEWVRRLATARARRLGLSREDAEDCGSECLLRAMRRGLIGVGNGAEDTRAPAQWQRMTQNFALNARRATARRKAHETELAQPPGPDGARGAPEIADSAPGPDAAALREEFWNRVRPALERLRPLPRELLLRHHLGGESCAELAVTYGKSVHAVEDSLHRARQRLREILERMGITEAELREYVATLTSADGRPREDTSGDG